MLNDKSILITGGTGSFGTAFTKYVLERYSPKRLVIFSRDEYKQFKMQQQFSETQYDCIRYFLGDVRDLDRLRQALRGIDYVIHAAALKQVPSAEYNPMECVKTNVHGAENVVNASIENHVGRVVALSTDKACNPINLYGATKLASDKIFIAANNISGAAKTRFAVVRYGNVLGSRGSVVPFFRKLIAEGATSLPITDQRMTRFWVTIEQAVNFVIESLEMMAGGEIFVPKVPSMKIVDLAKAMGPTLDLQTVGIRPGEKLHEELISAADAERTVELENRYAILPGLRFWDARDMKNYYVQERAASPVPEGFRYGSDNNEVWLTKKEFANLVS